MQRGEVWWVLLDEKCLVVLLSDDSAPELRAMRIVAPATAEEKRGFLILSGAEAAQLSPEQAVAIGTGIRAAGVEVEIEGLAIAGVLRFALPRDGHIFCTWLVTLTPNDLIERAGALSAEKLAQLGHVVQLAGIE